VISRSDLRALSDDALAEYDMQCRRLEQATAAVTHLEADRANLAEVISILKMELGCVIQSAREFLALLSEEKYHPIRVMFGREVWAGIEDLIEVTRSAAKCLE
jgi:hypothetical protein